MKIYAIYYDNEGIYDDAVDYHESFHMTKEGAEKKLADIQSKCRSEEGGWDNDYRFDSPEHYSIVEIEDEE